MIKEVQAKTLLSTCKNPSSWFGVKYNMNIYRGCEHQCIYCDSRSECYRIENFHDVIVKVNAIELLRKELSKKRIKGTVGTGAMSDPYTPAEKKYMLTRKALEVIAEFRYPVHIITKSNLILRDIEILQEINKLYACVAFTITTTDDALARKLEPGAPLPSERLKAMGVLSELGITTCVTMMPILPFIEDNEENILDIVKQSQRYGAKSIVSSIGMTLRDRQRAYYFDKLNSLYPGLSGRYEKKFGNSYSCSCNNAKKLREIFNEACYKNGISMEMPSYYKKISSIQLSILNGD